MNELRVTDPFAVEPMDEMFRQMLRPWRNELAERAPQIKLDVHENDASYTVKAEVPGVGKDDIDVRIEGNRVTLSAEVKKDTGREEGRPRAALGAPVRLCQPQLHAGLRRGRGQGRGQVQGRHPRADAAEEDQELVQAAADRLSGLMQRKPAGARGALRDPGRGYDVRARRCSGGQVPGEPP